MAAGGLDGVVVAETFLSEVDGERGRLLYRGRPLEALAGRSFEAVTAFLWSGELPEPGAPAEIALQRALGAARVRAFEALGGVGKALSAEDGMDAVRAVVAHGQAANVIPAAGVPRDDAAAAEVTAAVGVATAAWIRTQSGLPLVAPDPSLPHAEDLLRMATGAADRVAARAFEAYLVTVMDHGMNASTFTARVIASTGSDLVSAVTGAIGALKGPLHGGAPGPVLDMLDAVAADGDAERWLRAELAAGRRIMGMGHRIYRVRDPRAEVLEGAVRALSDGDPAGGDGGRVGRLRLAREVERTAERLLAERHPDRPMRANVELYTALVLEAVGLPRTAFSPCFAAGRVAGWCAHVDEQRATGRLIRPASRYVGPRAD